MSYKVIFLGLVCFYREHGARLALLPDGRSPGKGIDPHHGTIRVSEDAILGSSGWDGDAIEDGVFPLSPCEIIVDDVGVPGTLDKEEHDRRLPQLRQIDPNFEIDPARAQTIARMRIARGTLRARRMPDGEAVVSQLKVDHDGEITITVKPDDGSAERSIRLRAGTEIMVANMGSNPYDRPRRNASHFKIYEKLSVRPVSLTEPPAAPDLPELTSRHPLFTGRGPISLYVDCSNTGCC